MSAQEIQIEDHKSFLKYVLEQYIDQALKQKAIPSNPDCINAFAMGVRVGSAAVSRLSLESDSMMPDKDMMNVLRALAAPEQ